MGFNSGFKGLISVSIGQHYSPHTNTRDQGDDKWSSIPTLKDFILTLRTQDHQTKGFHTGTTQKKTTRTTDRAITTTENHHSTITSKEKAQSKDKETRLHSSTRTSKAKTTYRRKSKNSRKTQEKRREQPTFPTT